MEGSVLENIDLGRPLWQDALLILMTKQLDTNCSCQFCPPFLGNSPPLQALPPATSFFIVGLLACVGPLPLGVLGVSCLFAKSFRALVGVQGLAEAKNSSGCMEAPWVNYGPWNFSYGWELLTRVLFAALKCKGYRLCRRPL